MLLSAGIPDVPLGVSLVIMLAPIAFVVWDKFIKRKKETVQEGRVLRKDTIEEFQLLLNHQSKEIETIKKESRTALEKQSKHYDARLEECHKRETVLRDRIGSVERKHERALAHIDYMEHFLRTGSGRDYIPYKDVGDSQEHKALGGDDHA